MMIRVLLGLLSVLLGLLFIYSGWTKLVPIEPFEFTFVDMGFSWKLAPFVARFLIGLEFFLGLMFLFCLHPRFTARLSAIVLLVFCIYLGAMIAQHGPGGNCGCFGDALPMSPVAALIKNAIMLGLLFVLHRFFKGIDYGRAGRWLPVLHLVTAMVSPHIIYHVDLDYSQAYLAKKEDQFKLELDSLYKSATLNTPPRTLSQGKHIIAFMSLTCPHCRKAGLKMHLMKTRNPALPIYFVLNGDKKNLDDFFAETRATNIPYCQLNGKNFVYLAGLEMPAIYLVNNSTVEHWVDYLDLDQEQVEKWLATP